MRRAERASPLINQLQQGTLSGYGNLSMHLLTRNVASISADAFIKFLRWLLTFSRRPSMSHVQIHVPQLRVVVIETLWPLYSNCFLRTWSRSVIQQ